jgi:hypothetical protein
MKYNYSEENIKFLIENVKGISHKELTKRFNERFSTNLSESALANMKRKLNLTNDLNTKFKKGQTSWNKGRKMSPEQYEKCKKTMFQKGNLSNARPTGDERIDIDGYTYIKVKQPNKWVLKHRWLYEKEKGEIPKGYNLIFADGNKQNLNLDNLILVSNSELFIMNQKGLYKQDKELTKSGAIVAKVLDKVNKRKRDTK